jgi:hypothetical protein
MNEIKKRGPLIFAIVFVVVFCVMVFSGDKLEHIEDKNGPDNYNLQQITDYNIINMDIGAKNLSEKTSALSSLLEYSSKKFTGVAEIYTTNVWGNRLDITLYNLWVESGNFRVVLVHNDEIVHEFKLNELSQTYTLEKPNGTVSLRIAGESADFEFSYDLI